MNTNRKILIVSIVSEYLKILLKILFCQYYGEAPFLLEKKQGKSRDHTCQQSLATLQFAASSSFHFNDKTWWIDLTSWSHISTHTWSALQELIITSPHHTCRHVEFFLIAMKFDLRIFICSDIMLKCMSSHLKT